MYVVSANYRDRRSPNRWLIREESEHPSQARAFKSVFATGVTFRPSGQHESGFGCSMVAYCETAEGSQESGTVSLRFDGFEFVGPDLHVVRSCDRLELGADGFMLAELANQPSARSVNQAS